VNLSFLGVHDLAKNYLAIFSFSVSLPLYWDENIPTCGKPDRWPNYAGKPWLLNKPWFTSTFCFCIGELTLYNSFWYFTNGESTFCGILSASSILGLAW